MFFSVKQPLKIAGKEYTPCVCYSLPKFLEYTVEQLTKENKAVIYAERVFFQNGKVIEPETDEKADATVEKPRKGKKTKESFVEEEPLVENIADDEGF